MKNIALTLILFVFSSTTIEAASAPVPEVPEVVPTYGFESLIEQITVENGLVFITVDFDPTVLVPSCAYYNHGDYAFELDSATGEALYSLALSAYTAKLPVIVKLKSASLGLACSLFPDKMDVGSITTSPP